MACEDGRIDLHIHSTASDGTLTPAQILETAQNLGLYAIAITDHDTVDGVKQALESGIPQSMEFVCGVEISADIPDPFAANGTLHILGYFIDPHDPDLGLGLKVLQQARADRNPQIITKLQNMGMDISMQDVEKISAGGQTGRPHIAQALVQKGVVTNTREAFDLFLAKNKPAYVGKYRLPAQEAVDLIQNAGGIAVCAHPFSLEFAPDVLDDFIAHMKKIGLAGIEVHYSQHGPDLVEQYLELARKHSLFVTGGTDFHGDSKPDIRMGFGKGDLCVPVGLYHELFAEHEKLSEKRQNQARQTPKADPSELEDRISYYFNNKDLLSNALTHSSFANENPGLDLDDNERLEFLGDAVLSLVVGHVLMEKYDAIREGDLSRMRASLVNEAQLAQLARKLDLGGHLLLGMGESRAGGWDKNSILADCLEAVIAAVYLDGGFEAASTMVRNLYEPLLLDSLSNALTVDYKTRLQEVVQSRRQRAPEYKVIGESGPDHDKIFTVEVQMPENITAQGQGKSKKTAEQQAAQNALVQLGLKK